MRTPTCALALLLALACASVASADGPALRLETPMTPPGWALLQRALLRANADACRAFYERYFDERGWLLCVERWGGDDGPDDAIENCADWPLLHALGAPDDVLTLYKKAWEGHLRQYTLAKTTKVPLAREGMYYKEFPVMFDWLHHAEGLVAFHQQGLSDPADARYRRRARRFAGFYMGEDPDAPNYDAKHRIIRSLFNGSRGPLLRKATALDWAGDPIEIGHRFRLGHGERSYDEMLAHFKDYTDIVGDHPQNLLATTLALDAYMLAQEPKYKTWLLEYVDAWRQRARANGDLLPSNVGLDGTIGGAAGGKWYGGVYGWGFTVTVPQTGKPAHRSTHKFGFFGFRNAYLLTGDDRYLDVWRKQLDKVNAQNKVASGRTLYPHMHGERGWYDYTPERYAPYALELYCLSMKAADRARVDETPWLRYLDGKAPSYPEQALRRDLERVRTRLAGLRADPTTPDTRLADDPLKFAPVSVTSLVELTLGGVPPGLHGGTLDSRLRYFDPRRRRAGLPADVASLVERLTADSVTFTLVNVNQTESRTVIVQAGAYAEHQFVAADADGKTRAVDTSQLTMRLAPGCGGRLTLRMRRYVNAPSVAFPWQR